MSTTNFALFLIWILAMILVSFGNFGIKHKSKIKISIGWRLIIVGVIALSSMYYFDKNPRYNPDFNLENKIVDSIESSGNIDLSKVADFNFKKVHVCNNEMKIRDIVDDSLFTLSYKKIDNDSNYLIFVNENNKVVRYTILNKKYQILNSTFKEYARKDAIFKFNKLEYKDKTIYELNYFS